MFCCLCSFSLLFFSSSTKTLFLFYHCSAGARSALCTASFYLPNLVFVFFYLSNLVFVFLVLASSTYQCSTDRRSVLQWRSVLTNLALKNILIHDSVRFFHHRSNQFVSSSSHQFVSSSSQPVRFIIVATSSFHHRRTSLFHRRRNQFVSSSSQPVRFIIVAPVCFIIVATSSFHHRRNQFVSSSSHPVCFIIVATSLHPFSYLCSVMAQGQPCNDFRTNLVLCVLVYHSRTGARSALQRPRVVNVYNEWMFNPSPVIAQGDPATTVHIISTLLTDTISALLTNVVFGSLDSSLQ